MFRSVARGASLSVVLVLIFAGSALAASHGAGTVTNTEHVRGAVVFAEENNENPCTGELGTITGTAKNGVLHETTQADGEFWVTGTFEGTVTFTPLNPEGVSFSGHFTIWFGAAGNQKNEVQHATNTFHLAGTDGSRVTMHGTEHVSTNARGEVKVSFEKLKLSCG
jgi:hypothetical protein